MRSNSPEGKAKLFPFPAHAIFRVFENDAAVCKFDSNLIRSAKITSPSRFLAFVDHRLNFTVEHLGTLIAKHIQHAIKTTQKLEQFLLVFFFYLFASECSVYLAREIVDGGECYGSIEIIVHSFFEFL